MMKRPLNTQDQSRAGIVSTTIAFTALAAGYLASQFNVAMILPEKARVITVNVRGRGNNDDSNNNDSGARETEQRHAANGNDIPPVRPQAEQQPVQMPMQPPAQQQPEARHRKTVSAAPHGSTLAQGFRRFRTRYYADGEGLMEQLVREGAQPDFFMITCIDPRSGSDLVFDAMPGQQFNHQQMAAIVPPYEEAPQELVASLRFAIDMKRISHVVIMGHSHCGGCDALIANTDDEHIGPWVHTAQAAFERAQAVAHGKPKDELHRETERQVVIQSLQNALSYPMIAAAVEEDRLTVSGWYFDMEHGHLMEYDPFINGFREIHLPESVTPPHPPHHMHRPAPPPPGIA